VFEHNFFAKSCEREDEIDIFADLTISRGKQEITAAGTPNRKILLWIAFSSNFDND
jgi:hypothetical protein